MLCSILEKSTETTIYKHMYYDFVTSCIICPASSNHIPATSSEPVRSAGSVFWAFLTHQSLVIEWWWWSCQDGISPYFSLILCKHLRLQLPQEHAEFGFWKHSLKAWKTVWNILCSLLDWLEPAQCHGSCLSYACSLQTCQVLIRSWWSDADQDDQDAVGESHFGQGFVFATKLHSFKHLYGWNLAVWLPQAFWQNVQMRVMTRTGTNWSSFSLPKHNMNAASSLQHVVS